MDGWLEIGKGIIFSEVILTLIGLAIAIVVAIICKLFFD